MNRWDVPFGRRLFATPSAHAIELLY